MEESMIQVSELRYDNWVLLFKQPCKIYVIARDVVQVYGKDMGLISGSVFKYSDIEPIPLTAEIFIQCGFEAATPTYYRVVTKNLDYAFGIAFTGSGYFPSNATINYPIIYLHQLQNLYFALTGEELAVSLTHTS